MLSCLVTYQLIYLMEIIFVPQFPWEKIEVNTLQTTNRITVRIK